MSHLVKFSFFTILVFSLIISPAFGQSETNPSLILEKIEIPYDDFNKIVRDVNVIPFERPHTISWEIKIFNELVYANPDGNAVIRFYDLNDAERFLEVGMGSQPDLKFWVAVQIPEDTGYVVVHSNLERGWVPGANSIMAYTERSGLTVNNGERIVVSNLNIGTFEIGSYSVHGMESSTDPPATNSGILILDIMSGDPSANQFHLFPFFLAGGIGVLVAVLLITKKRS
ncbi:MAG: hypothetical protein ACE5EJ_04785 [Nitrosopumilaceae archaeon]